MNKDVVAKYEELRDLINGNINTIRHLLHQADMLSNLVEDLPANDAKKAQLEQSIKELYKVINELIKQINELFKQFVEFAESVKANK